MIERVLLRLELAGVGLERERGILHQESFNSRKRIHRVLTRYMQSYLLAQGNCARTRATGSGTWDEDAGSNKCNRLAY